MADNSYNISIETKAQLEEIQRLLEELRAINAEISKINGQTFSAVNASAAELSNTGKTLATAVQEQRKAFEEVSQSSKKTSEALTGTKNSSKELKDEINKTKSVVNGFYLELGAIGAHLATKLPSAFTASIKAFGEQEMATQKLATAKRTVLPVRKSAGSSNTFAWRECFQSIAHYARICLSNAGNYNLWRRANTCNAKYGYINGSFGRPDGKRNKVRNRSFHSLKYGRNDGGKSRKCRHSG